MIARVVASGLAGSLMGIGLVMSGMTDANKVINFLELSESWDPSLAFVMGSALLVYFIGFRVLMKRPAPVLAPRFMLPTRRDIDLRLVGGAALFGAGWGLGGFCPGPGIVSSMSGFVGPLVFVGTMTGGMLAFHAVQTMLQSRAKPSATESAVNVSSQAARARH